MHNTLDSRSGDCKQLSDISNDSRKTGGDDACTRAPEVPKH